MKRNLLDIIIESESTKLDNSLRRKANISLIKAGFDGNVRFVSVAASMNAAWKVLDKFGFEPGNGVPYIGTHGGSFSQNIRFSNTVDPFSPKDISNSVLYIQYAKLESGYEVVGYLS